MRPAAGACPPRKDLANAPARPLSLWRFGGRVIVSSALLRLMVLGRQSNILGMNMTSPGT